MKFYLSFGKIKIKYFLIIGLAIAFYFLEDLYDLYFDEKKDILEEFTDNKLLKSLLKNIGFSLMIFGDIIIKKISSIHRKDFDKNLLVSKKYNLTKKDSKYLIKKKDILFIILISLANLVDEFLAILIKTLDSYKYIHLDEVFVSLEFSFLFPIYIYYNYYIFTNI